MSRRRKKAGEILPIEAQELAELIEAFQVCVARLERVVKQNNDIISAAKGTVKMIEDMRGMGWLNLLPLTPKQIENLFHPIEFLKRLL